jgi:hypothetical protein
MTRLGHSLTFCPPAAVVEELAVASHFWHFCCRFGYLQLTQSIWSKIMRKIILFCASFFAIVLAFSLAPAQAQFIFWVSSAGSDSNSCFQEAPCKTFQGVINKSSNIAQINCLTSGDYGAFTVATSITIDCGTGNVGIVAVSNTAAVTVGGNGNVVLRHLHLIGAGSGGSGIFAFVTGGTLTVEDCVIHGMGNPGITFSHNSGDTRSRLELRNTQVFGNAFGIGVNAAAGRIISLTLSQVELRGNNAYGLSIAGAGVVAGTMYNSVVASNGTNGVTASAGQTFFSIEGSTFSANLTSAINSASAGTVLNVGSSSLGGNGTAVKVDSGSIVSFGNNQISANGADGNFTSTKALQ